MSRLALKLFFMLFCIVDIGCDTTVWNRLRLDIAHISVGKGGVWATHRDTGKVYYRRGTYRTPWRVGCGWALVPGLTLKRLDVGKDVVWGVDADTNVWMRSGLSAAAPGGTTWTKIDTGFVDVSVSQGGRVWGIKPDGHQVWRRIGASNSNPRGSGWEQAVYAILSQISVGELGVWGVNPENGLYYKRGTYGGGDTVGDPGNSWTYLGSMKYVSSSEDLVVAVNMANEVLVRNGITESRPTGTSWGKLNKTVTMVESFGGVLWGIDQDHDIWHTVYEAGQDVCNL